MGGERGRGMRGGREVKRERERGDEKGMRGGERSNKDSEMEKKRGAEGSEEERREEWTRQR